ncbi:MAG: fibronectin type III domain-containing protein, partial [Termitinemataceae bacterium]
NKTTSIIISPTTTTYKLTPNFILSMNTTYYWKIIAYDKRNSSTTSLSDGTFFVPIFSPSTFTIVEPSQNVFTRKPRISWTNAVHSEENSFISFYELNLSTRTDFLSKITVSVSTTYYIPQTNLLQNATYYLQIFAYDNFGLKSTTVTYSFYIHKLNIPQKTKQLNYTPTTYGFFISWAKVDKYEDGSLADDIAGYNVYRSYNIDELKDPIKISKYRFVTSTMTTSILELTQNVTMYYLVKVVTLTGVESEPSEIVSNYNQGSKVFYRPDINAKIILPLKVVDQLSRNGCELFIASSSVTTAEESQLNMFSKYDLFVTQDNKRINLQLELPIELEFTVIDSFSSILRTQNLHKTLTPKLFWHNGIEYIYVNSAYNPSNGKLNATTKNIGSFVLRAINFSDKNEIVNIYPKKIFTPSAPIDNKIHFVINNITASQPEGEIYDLDLRYVSKMKYENYELVWDGRCETGVYPSPIWNNRLLSE